MNIRRNQENRIRRISKVEEIDLALILVKRRIKDRVVHPKELEEIVRESINMSHNPRVVD